MKSRWTCLGSLFFFAAVAAAQYHSALPGYRYQFPRDNFSHPDFQTEWWYYTGNVKASDGHRFGFELTFFRQGVDRNSEDIRAWDVEDLYVAHLALSDLDGGKFLHAERTNRAGPGIAGASEKNSRVWNGNWQVAWHREEQTLCAIDERFAFQFALKTAKAPVIHGESGVSQKGADAGQASHYISLTRLNTSGEIQLAGKTYDVTGTAWMDHEFFTHQLAPDQVGWDWLSIQLDDNTELMLFHIRRKDGSIDPYSAGTFIESRGAATYLRANDFILKPAGATWKSVATGAVYPVHWEIAVPKLRIALDCSTALPSQELNSRARIIPAYWEGAVEFHGTKNDARIRGVGYLEMTGYDHPVEAFR
jgi:predicted secreted hydrolase